MASPDSESVGAFGWSDEADSLSVGTFGWSTSAVDQPVTARGKGRIFVPFAGVDEEEEEIMLALLELL